MTTPATLAGLAGLAGQPPAAATAPVLTLADVAAAYPTWRVRAVVDGCVAWAALVPSWVVHAATARELLCEIEASVQRRREGGAR